MMTATIIPFPVRGSSGARRPAVSAGPLPGVPFPPRLPAPPAMGPGTGPAFPPALTPARSESQPSRRALPGPAAWPAGREAYVGPCRRVRGLRSLAAAQVIGATTGPQVPTASAPQPASERMTRALEGLRTALAQQAGVVAAWRASLVELEGAVGSLQSGVMRQARAMQALGARLSPLDLAADAPAQSRPG